MWPFRRRERKPAPADVISGDLVASYSTYFKDWSFDYDDIEFILSRIEFDPAAFTWAQEAAACIRSHKDQIHAIVAECAPSECNAEAAEIHSDDLDEYPHSGEFDVFITGDDSWGDCVVDIIFKDGTVSDYYGSD